MTQVKDLGDGLTLINRLAGFRYGARDEWVPILTSQFATTRKGMLGPEGLKFFLKIARTAKLDHHEDSP
jgi:hypothetical protein